MIWDAIRKGCDLYRRDFTRLTLLSLFKMVFPLAFMGLFMLPTFFFGLGVFSNPDLLSALPEMYLGALGAYYFPLILLAILLSPFLIFLNMASVLTIGKDFRSAFKLIKAKYPSLLKGQIILLGILASILIESIFLYALSSWLGSLGLLAFIYVVLRLYFWDVFALQGNKNPLRASWQASKGREFQIFVFASLFVLLKASLPTFLMFLVFFIEVWSATSKYALFKFMERKNNKVPRVK